MNSDSAMTVSPHESYLNATKHEPRSMLAYLIIGRPWGFFSLV